MAGDNLNRLLGLIEKREAKVAVMGLGYVGLPIVIRFREEGFKVIGFDVDRKKVNALNSGASYIKHIPSSTISRIIAQDSTMFEATTDASRLEEADAIIICVPTPLSDKREPDLRFVEASAKEAAERMKPGALVSLESTTYPGTTEEMLLPLFEKRMGRAGEDFFLVYSPEREDPGRADFTTRNTPKIVGGVTEDCREAGCALYSKIVEQVVPVGSTRVAEMSKLLENIYRGVNIALVNELKMLCDRMSIDIWEVIKASDSKPFGFHAFYPGPGLGGHCIPVDPFYLTWKAREYDFTTRFIELAGEINTNMPYYVVGKVMEALNARGKSLKGSKILLLGIAYKKDVDDLRESPSLELVRIMKKHGAAIAYNDPFVPEAISVRKNLAMRSTALSGEELAKYDCVIIATDHSTYDYNWIVDNSALVVDTRNATDGITSPRIVKA